MTLMSMQDTSEKDDFLSMLAAIEIDPHDHDDMMLIIAGRFAAQCIKNVLIPFNKVNKSSITPQDIVLDFVQQNYETLMTSREEAFSGTGSEGGSNEG